MDSDKVERYKRLADGVARGLSYEFPGIEAEDISQEIMLHVLSHPKAIAGEFTDKHLQNIFRRIGTGYASRERYYYIMNSGQYVYTPKEVRKLLAAFFLSRDEIDPPKKESGVSVESGGICVALWDMDDAFGRLTLDAQQLIMRAYIDEERPKARSAEAKRLERGIDELTRRLNTAVYAQNESRQDGHEGPGSRRPMTNSAGQYATRKDF